MADAQRTPSIYVLAGTNGAGKSSVGGAMFRLLGASYFNPDEASRRILAANPGIPTQVANSAAWHQGRRLLERAIAERMDFAFETTLGGKTITTLLQEALARGLEVRIWYVGLSNPELHIRRVRARVRGGGHAIPEDVIRARYDASRRNLIRLLRRVTEVRVFDNSHEADPRKGKEPEPALVLHTVRGRVVSVCGLSRVPQWAKAIVAAAMTSG